MMSSIPVHNSGAAGSPARGAGGAELETLTVTEIFKSIQGESTWAGLPCIFVRLTGCHLRCIWCDTAYAYYDGEKMAIEAIVARCESFNCPLVEITGGEPLLQDRSPLLAQMLIDKGFTVLCETSGALPIDRLPAEVIKIMDLKCPDSGECERNDWDNIARLGERDEVKFVIASRRDYEWSRDVVDQHALDERCAAVLFSPAFGAIEPRDIAEWMLADGVNARFQLQMHRLIWPPGTRGV